MTNNTETLHKDDTMRNKYNNTDSIVSWVHPLVLCLFGVVCIIPYILTESIFVRLIQVGVLFFMAIQVKRIRIAYFIMLTLSIVFFYILVPQGKILYEWWFLTITEDALKSGVFRGLTLNGYVFLSLSYISPQLSLPTKYGALLSKSITYFTMMLESASNTAFRTFIKEERRIYKQSAKQERKTLGERLARKIDFLLSDAIKKISDENTTPSHDTPTNTNIYLQKTRGIVCISLCVLSTWGGVLIPRIL